MLRSVIACAIVFAAVYDPCEAQETQKLVFEKPIRDIPQEQQIQNTVSKSSIQCYDCNSKFDPRCGDPFDPYTIGIVNCSEKRLPHFPVLCRKIVQKVEGETRVIRGCGYIRDDHDDKQCFKRTGTANVEVVHCSCTTSLCNSANSIHLSYLGYFSLLVLAISNVIRCIGCY
ncbi:unnamed protein product [Acanthoscelides obtectus]|uniref:Protein sleepless n=1 Tax=Acanthoscelides obtectus TaxID=200917 RepID=A0A9P0KX92_ACAOB|nr:unnamed protein product [Acanthoscelides obtectus]CAK1675360.1 hypothetical protein AOBTE_LOCUS30163 [Acanthoscelides obtectus]